MQPDAQTRIAENQTRAALKRRFARCAVSGWRMCHMSEKRPIDAIALEEKAIYITGPKGSACHAVPLGLIQAAPTMSQQELRSYMLPWFSPFAAPWCGKIQRAFPKAYVTMNFELILVPRTNTYINLNHCSTPDEFKAKIIENCSRLASKGYSKPLRKEHLDGINKLLDTNFTQEDIEYIYTYLGNGIKHELCMKFVQSGYDLGVIDEGLQEKEKQE